MKKNILYLLLLFPALAVRAQPQLILSVVGSAGLDASAGNLKVSATLGEPVIFTASNNQQTLTQGYQQDQRVLISVGTAEPQALTGFRVFPNPANAWVELASDAPFRVGSSVTVFDAGGRLLSSLELPDGNYAQTIDFSNLPPGAYALRVHTHDGNVTFPVIKHKQ